jgi:hypothetical protein
LVFSTNDDTSGDVNGNADRDLWIDNVGTVYVADNTVSNETHLSTGTGDLYVEAGLEADGGVWFIDAYNNTVSGQPLYVNSAGRLGRTSSSLRYKTNIRPLEDDFSKILQAEPKVFNFINDEDQLDVLGYIAEEFDEIGLNNLVVYDDLDRPDAIRYDWICLYLNEVAKDHQIRIEELEQETETNNNETNQLQILIADLGADLAGVQESLAESVTSIIGQFNNLTVNEKIISPLVETDQLTANSIQATESKFGELLIQNEQGETVASIDNQGNASFSGQLTASKSKFGELLADQTTSDQLLVTGDATISGLLEAEEVRAKKVIADEIVGLESKFGQLMAASMSARNIAQNFEPQMPEEEDYSEIEALVDQILNTSLEATPQAELAGDITIQPTDYLTITNDLTVLGLTSLADTSVAGSLNVGGTMTLAENSINTLSETLYLQNLGLGGIDILAGKILIDQEGNMTVEGDVTVKGSLFANLLSPLPEQDLTIDLQQKPAADGEESGFGKLIIKGVDEEIVASIEASGTSTFKKLAIANAEEEVSQTSPTEIETNATAGQAVLPADETEINIKSQFVTDKTMIYVTPTSETQNKVLFVKAKKGHSDEETGWFKVGLDTAIDQDISFNWWIIN